ncbi:NAD-P-binding protein [Trametes versicolor FP-101664 SS1]|uniref:NAD-P-binding protein n=1 Tax=Trametes versicolor (strain FP-101664) TaxID=717944 RepID=UPI0004621F8B|nr:NAD-P-binding protein [Trametes versicolor FP-101664 SS1]EIW64611.1 NAD-P-binding protein [Trametes versicolor FP-101664 SS1]
MSVEEPTPATIPAEPLAAPSADTPAAKAGFPTTQKAWRAMRRGKPADVLALVDVPVPAKLQKGEVLVKVQAAALNPAGYKMMGILPGVVLRRAGAVEYDLAGVIVDANGSEFAEGDEVYGWITVQSNMSGGPGALTQYTRLPAGNLVLRSKNVTPTQAAGFSLAGLTAYQSLIGAAKLEAGQSVFINGGSTAVGSFAIQIAKARGARVTASASAKNEAYVRSLGADEFFDYTKAPLHEQLAAADVTPKFHVFYETVGLVDPALFTHSPAYLAPGGIFLSVGPTSTGAGYAAMANFVWNVLLRPSFLGGVNRKWKFVGVKAVPEDLKAFAKLVEEGKVRPIVDSVYAFEEAKKAYERVLSQRATGKVVVKVDPSVE